MSAEMRAALRTVMGLLPLTQEEVDERFVEMLGRHHAELAPLAAHGSHWLTLND